MSLSSDMPLAVKTLEFVFKAIEQERSMQRNGKERYLLDVFYQDSLCGYEGVGLEHSSGKC